ncbi:hypothetical protein GGR54DRAFT_15663 [Hypoxylon sp. NC1633]|nr:hypothetical protein GGR54DRAFT_15663 [Hypoxylon sp. NC1633]
MKAPGPPPPRPGSHPQGGALASYAGHDEIQIPKRETKTEGVPEQDLGLLGPAYVLEWTSERCSRTRVNGAEDLRASIRRGAEAQPAQLPSGGREHVRRLFVIQGLPVEYLQVLRDVLDVDARFVEAHVGRRSCRRMARRGRDGAVTRDSFACFDYPELFTSPNKSAVPNGLLSSADTSQAGADIVGQPPMHVISPGGDVAAFCRASLWLGSKADVLLVDRPAWTRATSDFQKAQYRSPEPSYSSISTTGKANEFSSTTSLDNGYAKSSSDIPSLETLLYESLAAVRHNAEDDVRSVVEDVAMHQWDEFFEALSADLVPGALETTALYRQIQRSLERNLSAAEFHARSLPPVTLQTRPNPSVAAWESLLARLGRHTALLSQLPSLYPSIPAPSNDQTQARSNPTITTINASTLPPNRPPNPNRRSRTSEEQNQQSLDRVSYMGGVLLPLSIVSSVLSMSDPFGPGGSMFYVFWAAGVPLVLIAILIIYADSLRKAEVWIEVAASGSEEESGGGGGGGAPGVSTPKLEQAVPVSYGEAVPMGRMGIAEVAEQVGGEDGFGFGFEEPGMMVEKMFRNGGGRKHWKKEQLGWAGACKAAFRIYRLKKGTPPNWAGNVRHGRTA